MLSQNHMNKLFAYNIVQYRKNEPQREPLYPKPEGTTGRLCRGSEREEPRVTGGLGDRGSNLYENVNVFLGQHTRKACFTESRSAEYMHLA